MAIPSAHPDAPTTANNFLIIERSLSRPPEGARQRRTQVVRDLEAIGWDCAGNPRSANSAMRTRGGLATFATSCNLEVASLLHCCNY
jgi:hypothetical protein